MMKRESDNRISETSGHSNYMDWNDVRNLARRVIRSASLAVMIHGELDAFTESREQDNRDEKLTG